MTTSLADYHSCSVCRTWILDPDNVDYRGDIKPKTETANEAILLSNLSLFEIRRGSSTGCHFSEWLISQWKLFGEGKYESLLHKEHDLLLYAVTWSMALMTRLPVDEISFFGLWDGKSLSLRSPGYPKCVIATEAPIDVLTPKGDVADGSILNRPINPQIGSLANMDLARSWLRTCLTSHRKCQKPSHAFMPKRVLQLSRDVSREAFTVRLCVDQQPGQYVALSYCWGGDQPYKTTKARMQSGQFDLAWEEIPKTIQDAVVVTAALGLQYLWIDSFCIIQDDPDDFALQMAEVPSIYAYAAVTIVACRAETASQGFLRDINLDKDTSLAVRLPFRCPGGSLGNAFITSIANSRDAEPIDYRAWTFQEFYLPARLLQFGSRQLRWQCPESSMEDGFSDGWKRGYNPEDSLLQPSTNRSQMEESFSSYASRGMRKAELYAHAVSDWMSLIAVYTFRRLAYAEDRSWAASGLAEAFSTVIDDEYLAGHWRGSLPNSLLWFIATDAKNLGHGREAEIPQLGRRLEGKYLGPSWSWTSVLGKANCLYSQATTRDTRLVLLDAGVTLIEPKARYGGVSSGFVTVRGRMRNALYYGPGAGQAECRLKRLPCGEVDGDLVLTRMFPDAIETEFLAPQSANPVPIHVCLLEVGCAVAAGKRGPVGLVLREVPCPPGSEYRTVKRLGMFHINAKAIKLRPPVISPQEWDLRVQSELRWFDGCDQEVVRIV
ncbi:HET-domain-containing protein [Coniochaeta ligniaria NRRL 30616]|uniref:HET-domain-containing protein n=1 Tax=Coniochaeta ligniaria NRRL 30616 TaxID=1408157 RepID=A0A1J7K514_9PEZI|nr:HET-domain-containing protein [Coniochaeta ligniaria NRRL 30616]